MKNSMVAFSSLVFGIFFSTALVWAEVTTQQISLNCGIGYTVWSNELDKHFSDFAGPYDGRTQMEGVKKSFSFRQELENSDGNPLHMYMGEGTLKDNKTGFELKITVSNDLDSENSFRSTGLLSIRTELKSNEFNLPLLRDVQYVNPGLEKLNYAGVSSLAELELPVSEKNMKISAYSPYVGENGGTIVVGVDQINEVSAGCIVIITK